MSEAVWKKKARDPLGKRVLIVACAEVAFFMVAWLVMTAVS
ncbi:MAG: hypothetical protein AAF730_00350 [Bacteroidota bacterium]